MSFRIFQFSSQDSALFCLFLAAPGAGNKALAAIEIRKSSRGTGVELIVDASDECHRSGRDVVNRFGIGVGALEIQPAREVVAQGGLQSVVVRVGVGREMLKIHRINSQIRRTRRGVLDGRIHDGAGPRPAPTGIRDGHRMLGGRQRETTGYRLIHGESDGWPGLVLDRYDTTLVLKLYTAAWLPRLDE